MANLFSVHAAVMAINEVLEKEDSDETFKALQNPAACLVDLLSENGPRYQVTLLTSKRDKSAKAGAQVKLPYCTIYTIEHTEYCKLLVEVLCFMCVFLKLH